MCMDAHVNKGGAASRSISLLVEGAQRLAAVARRLSRLWRSLWRLLVGGRCGGGWARRAASSAACRASASSGGSCWRPCRRTSGSSTGSGWWPGRRASSTSTGSGWWPGRRTRSAGTGSGWRPCRCARTCRCGRTCRRASGNGRCCTRGRYCNGARGCRRGGGARAAGAPVVVAARCAIGVVSGHGSVAAAPAILRRVSRDTRGIGRRRAKAAQREGQLASRRGRWSAAAKAVVVDIDAGCDAHGVVDRDVAKVAAARIQVAGRRQAVLVAAVDAVAVKRNA
jgi:hypothetical protein